MEDDRFVKSEQEVLDQEASIPEGLGSIPCREGVVRCRWVHAGPLCGLQKNESVGGRFAEGFEGQRLTIRRESFLGCGANIPEGLGWISYREGLEFWEILKTLK